jgi:hypothetical protein
MTGGPTAKDHVESNLIRFLRGRKEGELVHAYCYVAKDKRSFYLHHITRMEDHEWVSINSVATASQSPVSATTPTGNPLYSFCYH